MSDEVKLGLFTLTHEVEMVFPHLFEPRQYKGKGDLKHDAMFVFDDDHPDLPEIRKLLAVVAQAKFGSLIAANKAAGQPAFYGIKFPLKAGDKIADEAKQKNPPKDNEFLRGRVCITARSQYEPRLCVNMPGRGFVDFRDEAKHSPACKAAFYAGVRVLAELNFVAVEVDDRQYVTAYLNMVGSLNKGERRGGGKSGNETFKGYVGHISADDPTAGVDDDEIPF